MIDATAVIGAIGSLIAGITMAGLTKRWVFGWVYQAKADEADFWRDAFLKSIGQTDQAITVAKKATRG